MPITVYAYKWDGSLKYHWPGEIIRQDKTETVVEGAFRREYRTEYCHFLAGDKTVEYYPRDTWYNVCQIFRNGTELLGVYCNLSTPAVQQGKSLTYIDLELDLFIYPDGRMIELDAAEYKRLAANGLPATAAAEAEEHWQEMLRQVEARTGAFAVIGPGQSEQT